MDGMGAIRKAFLLSSGNRFKIFFWTGCLIGVYRTASFLQSARCPFVKQTHPAALCSELAAVIF